MYQVLETAYQVARLSSTKSDVPFKEMANNCEELSNEYNFSLENLAQIWASCPHKQNTTL